MARIKLKKYLMNKTTKSKSRKKLLTAINLICFELGLCCHSWFLSKGVGVGFESNLGEI